MLSNLIQSLDKQMKSAPLSLKAFQPGQIFHGKIHKLFPNQTAEVQVGEQKFIARIEVPLTAGGRYWFQVLSGEGKIHLKVLPTENRSLDRAHSMTGLLRQMHLPQTKLHQELIAFFAKEELPITKENVQGVVQLLNGTDKLQESLGAVKEIISKDLPLTKEVFSSLLSVHKNESLQGLLQNLQSAFNKQVPSKTGQQINLLLSELTLSAEAKTTNKMISQLFQMWVNPNAGEESHHAFTILKKLSIIPSEGEGKLLHQAAARLISEPKGLSLTENEGKQLNMVLGQQDKSAASVAMKSLLSDVLNREGEIGRQTILQHILSLFQKEGKQLNAPLLNSTSLSFTEEESKIITQVLQKANDQAVSLENGKEVSTYLRKLVEKLGINYEHRLFQTIKDGGEANSPKLDVLKSLLIRFIGEEPQGQLRERAEALLHRLTGIQLQTQESGPLQQFIMQVPISLWNKVTDLTIQWNGRKKENGQIDPDYCRVLFYLDLEYLKETVVDLQIQQRVIKITVINNTEAIRSFAGPHLHGLKKNLEELGFKLSTVNFRETTEEVEKKTKKDLSKFYQSRSYTGVDIKI